MLAVTAAASGSAGNYTAEPLSEADEWVNGGSSGAYTSSYPVQVPPVPGGLTPAVSLSYDSQATDGLSSATNNEPSWVGEGWDYSPGFIETELGPCQGGLMPASPGDLCPPSSGPITTVSLNGISSTLVCGSSSCSAKADNGAADPAGDRCGLNAEVLEADHAGRHAVLLRA